MRLTAFALVLTLGSLATPPPAEAQQPGKVPRIGYLSWGFQQVLVDASYLHLGEMTAIAGQLGLKSR